MSNHLKRPKEILKQLLPKEFFNQMSKVQKQINLLNKFGKWGPIAALTWLALHIVIPLALLRIPVFEKYLIALENKLPFTIPGIG